jgi:hypothetical protein
MLEVGFSKAVAQNDQGRVKDVVTASKEFYKAFNLTPEEQTLVDKGAVMQSYKPGEHSRHFITTLDSVTDPQTGEKRKIDNPPKVICFVFGVEDAEPARKEGRRMAAAHYSRAKAGQTLSKQAQDKYHDRFFIRAYVQEGQNAYDEALKGH